MSAPGFRFASAIAVLALGPMVAAPADAADPAPTSQATEAKAAQPAGVPLLVLPYQPILRSVKQAKAQQATEYLTKELSNTDGLTVMQGGVATDQASEASLDAAVALQKKADDAEKNKNIAEAIKLHRQAIAEFEKNAAAMTDIAVYIQAHHRLARAMMWSGDDAAAKAMIDMAARLDPTAELKADMYSRLYRRWFTETAQKVVRDRPGDLLVKSVLPGASIELDGREMNVAPVLINRVLPGKHLLIAKVEGVPPFGAVVNVKSQKKTEFVVNFAGVLGGVEVGDVADAIAQNGLPKTAVQKAVAAGKNAGARFVVAGGLASDRVGNDLNVYTFVVNVKGGQVKALNPVDFDSEMLTAESDVIRVVRQVDAAVKGFDASAQMIAMIEKRTAGFATTTLNQVNGAPPRRSQRAQRQRKNGPRKVFKALEGGTIRIKDEEE